MVATEQGMVRGKPGPRVSVIMSVHNDARYVQQAIESIVAQTFEDFEFVIVDDGSTDETPDILASFEDPRIRILVNEVNLGLTPSLNRGVRASSGELVARQDSDDASLPERLAHQVAYLDSHHAIGLVGSSAMWIDADGTPIQRWRPLTEPAAIQQTLLWAIPFLHGTFMFRRDCLRDVGGGYNEIMPVAQDCDLLLRMSERWDLTNLPEILYRHRRHEDSVTAKRKADQQRYLRLAQQAAVGRRLTYGWARLGLSRGTVPAWVEAADRRWLAQRYVWWSAGARQRDRGLALRFLLIALLLDPVAPDAWRYMAGIVGRKAQRLWELSVPAGESECPTS